MPEQRVPGFLGKHSEVRFEPPTPPPASGPGAGEVDLVGMARWCQNYLAHNPQPEHGWEPRFSLWGLHLPVFDPWPYCEKGGTFPDLGLVDPIVEGDTDSRMDYAYVYMREMAGAGPEVERAEQEVRRRVRGYVHEDGLSWIRGPIAPQDPGTQRPWAVIWTTAKALATEAELLRLSGDDSHRQLARRLFEGLRGLAVWDTGRAYYPGGAWRDGEWSGEGGNGGYLFVVEPLVRYWETSGDEEALDFARAYAEGMLANLPPNLGTGAVQPDGSFNSHLHCQMHAVSGVAHLGAVTREPRYVEWARRVYEFVRQRGTDYGWFPEHLDHPDHVRHTEICLVADMIFLAVWLGEAGYAEYFDQAERYARNMLRHAQLLVTPELESLYRQVHADAPEAEVDRELEFLRHIQGAFVSSPTLNDLVDEGAHHHGTAGEPPLLLDLMGCCPPEGMRALRTVWRHTVTSRPEGVFVNMALPCRHEEAEVATGPGSVTVTAGQDATYFLRPPAWAPRAEVRLYHAGREITPEWRGDYVRTPRLRRGEEVTLVYPLVSFVQEQEVQAGANSGRYRITWRGNDVVGIDPQGRHLPLFTDRALPPSP